MSSSVWPTANDTLGAELERDRLERRVRRMTVAIASLRERAGEHRRELRAPPRRLRQAIADFEAQIDAMNVRLRELVPERMPIQIQRRSGSHENDH
jgi:hypothetical protein